LIERRVWALLALSLLSACAVEVIDPTDPAALIPDRLPSIPLGEADRAAVRAVLGDPALASAYWRFDLFRADTEQTSVPVALTPWPVPFAHLTDALYRYTLVVYEPEGRARAGASGIFRRPAKWRNVSPIKSDFPALHLRAGDLMFFLDPEGARRENLLVAPPARDNFLRDARASAACTVVLGCGEGGCGDVLSVDAGPDRRLPLRTANRYWLELDGQRESWLQGVEPPAPGAATPWLEALVPVRLPPGEHRLRLSARHLGGRHDVPFSCRAGEVSYLVVDARESGSGFGRALVDWRVERHDALPERFALRPLVLLDDGQWTVDADRSD
jgi:hypothetical protein